MKKMTISNSLLFGLAKLKKGPHLNYPYIKPTTTDPSIPVAWSIYPRRALSLSRRRICETYLVLDPSSIILFWNRYLWNIFCLIVKCICLNLFALILLSFVVILLNKEALNYLLYHKALFSSFLKFFRDIVAHSFVCGNYCPIMN